jgi:hypothetical protein
MQFSSLLITYYVFANPIVLNLITLITAVIKQITNPLIALLSPAACHSFITSRDNFPNIKKRRHTYLLHFVCHYSFFLSEISITYFLSVPSSFVLSFLAIIRVSQSCQMCNIPFPVSNTTLAIVSQVRRHYSCKVRLFQASSHRCLIAKA